MGHSKYEGHREGGAVAVEIALVLPLLVALMFGIIDFGRIFNTEIQLSQAAREGARIAALGLPSYSSANATDRAQAAAPAPAFGGSGPIGATAMMCSAAPTASDNGTVTVTYLYEFILPLPSITLTQTAVMKCAAAN